MTKRDDNSLSDASDDRFLDLVVRYTDGSLNSEETAEFNSQLRSSAERRDHFAEYCVRAQMIREILAPEASAAESEPADLERAAASVQVDETANVLEHQHSRRGLLALAAILLVGGLLALLPDYRDRSVAEIVHTVDAQWVEQSEFDAQEQTRGLHVGDRINAQRLRLKSGLVKLLFDKGTVVTIEGPADFEILTVDLTVLRSGTLTASVPEPAIGFRVDTPSARVIDLGTAFGVDVDASGATDVCVFEGEVDVSTAEARAEPLRLREGDAVRASNGRVVRELEFNPRAFGRSWPVHSGVLSTSGGIRFATPGPLGKVAREEDDTSLLILPEKRRLRLKKTTRVNIAAPGDHDGRGIHCIEKLPKGLRVRSYLLQFNPTKAGSPRASHQLAGMAEFEHPIVGIITSTGLLEATDRELGGHRRALESTGRGLESGGRKEKDLVHLSEDRKTLILDLQVKGQRLDQMRVLVAHPKK